MKQGRSNFTRRKKNGKIASNLQDALLQHTKRVAYQAGIWCSNQSMLNAPPPEGWGWTKAERKIWIQLVVNWLNVPARVQVGVVQGVFAKSRMELH